MLNGLRLLYNEGMNFITLDKQSKTPLYQQLMDSFIKAIEDYTLLPEQRLPSEEVLCQAFGISRSVVKLAYQKLEDLRYISRNPKGGSYVYPHYRYQAILDHAPFFSEALKQSPYHWTYTLNLDELMDHQRHLKISYFIEGLPICVSDLTLPPEMSFVPHEPWTMLIEHYPHSTTFKVKALTKYEAQFFNLNESIAVFEMQTLFREGEHIVATLNQWISPYMGELIVEV